MWIRNRRETPIDTQVSELCNYFKWQPSVFVVTNTKTVIVALTGMLNVQKWMIRYEQHKYVEPRNNINT